MRPNNTLLKIGEALDNREKGSVVSQDLGKAFETIYLYLLLQKAKANKVLRISLGSSHCMRLLVLEQLIKIK